MNAIPKIEDIIGDYPEFTGVHPIANAFPMKPDDEFWELVEHIRDNGVAQELMRERGTGLLIDGRNRLLAVSITQSLFEVVDIEPEHVLAYVTAGNLHAKKFDASQKAVIASRLMPFYTQAAKERQLSGLKQNQSETTVKEKVPERKKKSQARDEAGKAAGVNGRYVDMAAQIASVDANLADDVLNGKVKLQDAYAKAKPVLAAAKAEEKANMPAQERDKARVVTADGRVTEIDKPSRPVFNATNDSVSWAKWTWNPVTGCNHGCKFCYAREIAHNDRMAGVYPFQFAPAFHDYRLSAPSNTKRPNTTSPVDGRVFVCSMADLFGKWVPDEWIQSVFDAAANSPEWEYLFLTKWPRRYSMLATLPRAWLGASIIKQSDVERVTNDMTSFEVHSGIVRWVSLEPMLEPIKFHDLSWCDLVVIGAQTATTQPDLGRVPAFSPQFEWVADVVSQCRAAGVPCYLKPNLLTDPGMAMPMEQPTRHT